MSAREKIEFELLLHHRLGLRSLPVAPASEVEAEVPAQETEQLGAAEQSPDGNNPQERSGHLDRLAAEISTCTKCQLCEQRTLAVPGEGAIDPPILFIGEGPGADEDRSGRPFVGRAGQLLNKMIEAMGHQRGDVFIANVVKCRPPQNRTPLPQEVGACLPYLEAQIQAIRPLVICTLGAPATKALVPTVRSISAARGREFRYCGVPLVPTFHPAYLLRNPAAKRDAWEDLQKVMEILKR